MITTVSWSDRGLHIASKRQFGLRMVVTLTTACSKSTMPSAIVVTTWFCPTVYVDEIVVQRVVMCDRSQKLDLEQDLSQNRS
jgi:hypothetical protein